MLFGPLEGDYVAPDDVDLVVRSDATDALWGATAVGDLDGDGAPELAMNLANGYIYYQGAVAIHSEIAPGARSQADADARLDGASWEQVHTEEALGDVNGDGLDDLLIGTIDSVAYIVYGPMPPGTRDVSTVVDVEVVGADLGAYDGKQCGDLDGDGLSDLWLPVGVPHEALNVLLAPLAGVVDADSPDSAVITVDRIDALKVQDVDGDGVPDALIGAMYLDPPGVFDAGGAWLISGADL